MKKAGRIFLLAALCVVLGVFVLTSCDLSYTTGETDALIEDLVNRNNILNTKIEALETEIADLKAICVGLNDITARLSKIDENASALDTLKKEYDAKVAELEAASKKNADDLAKLNSDLGTKIDALEKEIAALEKEIAALKGGAPVAPDLPKSGVGECGLAYITYDGATCTVTGIGTYGETDLDIPSKIDGYTVRAIANEAFAGTEITSLSLPDTLDSIGACAFAGCNALTEIEIPASVGTVGEGAFVDCAALDTVTIPTWAFSAVDFNYIKHLTVNGGTTIPNIRSGDKPIENTVLETVVLGPSVRTISSLAFYDYLSLTSVVIPEGVRSIESNAFGSVALEAVYITDLAAWCGISFADSPGIFDDGVFLYLNGEPVTDLVIPEGVTSIGDYAFYDYRGLTSVTIPEGVTSIGEHAFAYCSGLTNITIGNGVTSIGYGAFSSCSNLTYNEYDNAYYLGNTGNPYLCLVKAKTKGITSCTIHTNTKFIYDMAFEDCTGLTSITIGNGVTSIGYGAFSRCRGLTSITIPNSVTSIGSYAFTWCSGLTSITIPDSVTSIGSSAFSGCSGLTIYCEAASKPAGWPSYWNDDNRPVVWGYTGE